MDRLTSMSVFARVLELRSFSGAARDLGISQATVSKHVQTLEDWLGRQLLTRTTRRVEPTREGEGFYVRCQRILEEIDDVRIEDADNALQGRIRLGCSAGLATVFLGSALGRVIAAHPRLSVDVALARNSVDPAHGGQDALISLGEPVPAGMLTQRLAELPLVLCAAPAYLAGRGEPQAPAALSTHDCLTGAGHEPTTWRFRLPNGNGQEETAVPVRGRLASSNFSVLHDAAVSGAGILLAPPRMVEADLSGRRLVPVLTSTPPAPAVLSAVYPPERHLSTRLRGVLDALSTAFAAA